jgi:hypothetical protein
VASAVRVAVLIAGAGVSVEGVPGDAATTCPPEALAPASTPGLVGVTACVGVIEGASAMGVGYEAQPVESRATISNII